MKKERLDILLVKRNLVETRAKAQALIMSGEVKVADRIIDKCGTMIDPDAQLTIIHKLAFVSRGGIKLDNALDVFKLDIVEKVAVDIGASTGGFTDCLLKRQAKKVYAVDVGFGQLDNTLKADRRVIQIEHCNARYLNHEIIPEKIDIVTIDVSFISLKKILVSVRNLDFAGYIIALIKPQFEAGRKYVKKGVVKDPNVHAQVVKEIADYSETLGYHVNGITQSVLKGPKGNIEYFILLSTQQTL